MRYLLLAVKFNYELSVWCDTVCNFVKGTVLNNYTIIYNNNTLAKFLYISKIMSGKNNCCLTLRIYLLDKAAYSVFGINVQTDSRLVKEKYVR